MEFNIEQQIIHQLLLRSGLQQDIGLFHGKIGIVIFFAHYHKLTNNPVFEDAADELMDELMKGLHKELSIDFGSGLSGIGWGIEYLIQNELVEFYWRLGWFWLGRRRKDIL